MSLMSSRSPSVNVISSMSNLEALAFFHGPDLFVMRGRFSCVDVMLGSAPSIMSFAPCLVDKFRPPSSCIVLAPVAYAIVALSMAFTYSVAIFVTLQVTFTSMANCSLCFCWTSSLVASFCFCVVVLSYSARFRTRHLGGHDSSMEKMESSITMKGSLVQFYVGSLRALIDTLCISALKSAKLRRLLYIVGDRHSLLLIYIRMLISMSTQKILVSWIHVTSFVAQSDAYFVASGKSCSI